MEREPKRPKFKPDLPEVKLPKPEVKRPKLTPELPKANISKVKTEGIREYIKEKIGGKKLLYEGELGKNLPIKRGENLLEKATKGEVIEVEGKVIEKEPKRLYEGGKGENLPVRREEEKLPTIAKEGVIDMEGKVFEQFPGRPLVEEPMPEPGIEVPEPAGQRLRLRPEIRRERPWARELVSEVGITFGKEKGLIKKSLEEELEHREIEKATEWFQDPANEETIRDAGEDPENENVMYMRTVAEELGGLADLADDPDYDHLSASRYALGDKKVSIGRAQIILHQLGERKSRLGEELDEAKRIKNKPLVKSKEKELEKLFNIRKGLAEKVSGRNLRQEAKGELWMSSFREKTIGSKIEEKISGTEEIEGIDTYAGNLENTRRRYDAARRQEDKKLVILSTEKELKKRPETKRVMDALERTYREQGEEGMTARQLTEAIYTRQERERGPLFDMEGDWEGDKPRILQFFGDSAGYAFNPEYVELAKIKLDAKKNPYERAFGGDVSLVHWTYDLIFEILSAQREAERR